MLKNKHFIAVFLLSVLLCSCSAEHSGQNVSETSVLSESTSLQTVTSDETPAETTVQTVISDETPDETSVLTETASGTDISAENSETASETTSETEPKSAEQLALEEKILEAAGLDAELIYPSFIGDFDGDGSDELFAVCRADDTFNDIFGSLWYASADNAMQIYPANEEWGGFRTAEVGGDTLILVERRFGTGSVTYCYRIESGSPVELDTFNVCSLTQTDGADLIGLKRTYDFCTDGTGSTLKPYWFYYRDGSFHEYSARSIAYENFIDGFNGSFAKYAYLQPYFDEIKAENGVITDIIVRDNGIVNINYKIIGDGKEFLAYRYFRTLSVKDGEVTDITPEINEGNYEVSIEGNLLDLIMY